MQQAHNLARWFRMSGRMSSSQSNVDQPSAVPRRRRHKLRRAVIILLLGLAAIVWSGPYLASTDIARNMIVPAINSRIYGTVWIDDISLSWLGPCRITGLRVVDTSGRDVLRVKQILWDHGAWRGLTDVKDFGKVDVIEPSSKLFIGPDGGISLVHAISLKKPSGEPLPKLKGRVTIRNGSVHAVSANGQTGELSGLDARFDFDTLKDVAGEFSWDSVETLGVVLSKATFKPTFRNDRLDIPVVTIPISSLSSQRGQPAGWLRVGGEIDFSGAEPVLKVPGVLQVAENITVDQKLSSDLISRIFPILYNPRKLIGQVSLSVSDLQLPLGESIKRTGSGSGKLVLKDVRIQSDGLMTNLLNLGGLSPLTDLRSMKISDLVFEIKDGRCYYDNLTVVFADTLDMKFSGSVGFDDTLDMIVSLPVLPKQLAELTDIISPGKIAAGIGLDKLSPLLGEIPIIGSRRHYIDIRITGTRQRPTLGLPPILDPLLKPRNAGE